MRIIFLSINQSFNLYLLTLIAKKKYFLFERNVLIFTGLGGKWVYIIHEEKIYNKETTLERADF